MSDARATVRSAIINGLTKHCIQTGLQMNKTTDLLIEDLLESIFDKPVRWAVSSYARECDTADDQVALSIDD